MDSPGNLKAHLFDLADQDREALARIRKKLDLPSNALAVRYALRVLEARLEGNPPKTMVEMATQILGGVEVTQQESPTADTEGQNGTETPAKEAESVK